MNNKQLDTNQYLTDAAKKMDSIMNGTVYENGKCLKDTLSEEEIRTLKSEIESVIVQKARENVQFHKRAGHLIGIEDEYEAELILELYKNLYRFNNEKYMQVKKNYCFETFLKSLSKRARHNVKLQ